MDDKTEDLVARAKKVAKKMVACLKHQSEVTEFYREQLDQLPSDDKYKEIEQRYLDFLEKCNLQYDELNHELANITGFDYESIKQKNRKS